MLGSSKIKTLENLDRWSKSKYMLTAVPKIYGGNGDLFSMLIKRIYSLGEIDSNAGFIVSQSSILMMIYGSHSLISANKKIQRCLKDSTNGYRISIAGSEQGISSRNPRAVLKKNGNKHLLSGEFLYGDKGFENPTVSRGKDYVTGLDPECSHKILLSLKCNMDDYIYTVFFWANLKGVDISVSNLNFFQYSFTNSIRLHNVIIDNEDVVYEGRCGEWSNEHFRNSTMLMIGILANMVGLSKAVLIESKTNSKKATYLKNRINDIENDLFSISEFFDLYIYYSDMQDYQIIFSQMLRLKINFHFLVKKLVNYFSYNNYFDSRVLLNACNDLSVICQLEPLKHNEAINFLKKKR